MTYCLGIMTHEGLIMASDSRTNAGYDDVNVCTKMHRFVVPGERAFILLCSGSLSLSQSVLTILDRDFRNGRGLASAATMYDAARVIGEGVRRVSTLDRPDLERDGYRYNVHFILGGQIRGETHRALPHLSAGNPLSAAEGIPLFADRRNEIWPADSRSRGALRSHVARRRSEIRAVVVELHDALERHRGPADRYRAL